MPGMKDTGVALRIIEEIFEQEEFGMMTKQAELKKQAYASTLKSRALSVLIYLIDRSNKELTCFPAIPTMAEQLHISVSTVKRALHELLDSGYIKKDARFREKNKGQTSNLYTLVLFDGQPRPDDSQDFDCDKRAEMELSGEAPQEKEDKAQQEVCQVGRISFDVLKERKEAISEAEMEEVQGNMAGTVQENYQKLRKENTIHGICTPGQIIKQFFAMDNENGFFLQFFETERSQCRLYSPEGKIVLYYLWTGAGVSLMPP